jgi:sphingomyelin phosphodiesterase acid-like 3
MAFLMLAGATFAQIAMPDAPPAKATVSAVLISDIHFEPFWDPAKASQLAAAPTSEWKAILAAAPSPDQPRRFAALQQSCHTRGADTPFALFNASLKAMRSRAYGAYFVAVGGDLLSHALQCKYNILFPNSTAASYNAFAEKTLQYVIGELHVNLPGIPVYIALGNNDSGCGDYRQDAHSEFLAVTGQEVTKYLSASERRTALESFSAGGYYSVSLPAPIENARLLVLNDIFMSSNYATCAGKPDSTAAAEQLTWLHRQLTEARANQKKIWVMGHIPPGVDLYATATSFIDICSGRKPVMFLSSESLADELVEFSDVVELAIFAHTHMDETRLLKDDGQSSKSVAVKMIPSISPINGNHPSFTVVLVDPATAALHDYKVFVASNPSGVDAAWTEEYDFARSDHATDYSPNSITQLIAGFAADPGAKTQASQNYIADFSVGYVTPVLHIFWPEYVCTLSNHTQNAFKACLCSAAQ